MKIEKEEILFLESRLPRLRLNELQVNYLQILLQEKTIEKTFLFYLRQGWLINFNEFHGLLKNLVKERALHNLNFYPLFDENNSQSSNFQRKENLETNETPSMPNFEEKLFFKNLGSEALVAFKKNSQSIQVPEKSLLIREGDQTRDLFVVLEGKLSIYKTRGRQKIRIADLEPGSVFGEASFLWGAPRSADVVTQTASRLLRFKYNENDFSNLIQTDLAQKNQIRFWALHALMKSPVLRDLPSDNVNELIQCGKQINLKPNETLVTENSMGTSFYILVQGHLQILQNGKKINQLGQGDLLGEVALFISAGRRTATAISMDECLLLEINKDIFYKILSRNFFLACEVESLAWDRITKDKQRLQA